MFLRAFCCCFSCIFQSTGLRGCRQQQAEGEEPSCRARSSYRNGWGRDRNPICRLAGARSGHGCGSSMCLWVSTQETETSLKRAEDPRQITRGRGLPAGGQFVAQWSERNQSGRAAFRAAARQCAAIRRRRERGEQEEGNALNGLRSHSGFGHSAGDPRRGGGCSRWKRSPAEGAGSAAGARRRHVREQRRAARRTGCRHEALDSQRRLCYAGAVPSRRDRGYRAAPLRLSGTRTNAAPPRVGKAPREVTSVTRHALTRDVIATRRGAAAPREAGARHGGGGGAEWAAPRGSAACRDRAAGGRR